MNRFLFSLGLAVFLFASASGMYVDDTNDSQVASEVSEETLVVEASGVAVFESEEIFTETREEYSVLPGTIREIFVGYGVSRRQPKYSKGQHKFIGLGQGMTNHINFSSVNVAGKTTQVYRSWSWYGEPHQFLFSLCRQEKAQEKAQEKKRGLRSTSRCDSTA